MLLGPCSGGGSATATPSSRERTLEAQLTSICAVRAPMCRSSAERERCITTTHEIATSATAAPRTARLHSTHRPTRNALILHPVAPERLPVRAPLPKLCNEEGSRVEAGTARGSMQLATPALSLYNARFTTWLLKPSRAGSAPCLRTPSPLTQVGGIRVEKASIGLKVEFFLWNSSRGTLGALLPVSQRHEQRSL